MQYMYASIPILKQVSTVYVHTFDIDPVTWKQLQQRFSRVSSGLEDVLDGKEYQRHLEFLSEKANLSVTMNTDGTDVFRSSTASLYPIWVTINELPPLVRLAK